MNAAIFSELKEGQVVKVAKTHTIDSHGKADRIAGRSFLRRIPCWSWRRS